MNRKIRYSGIVVMEMIAVIGTIAVVTSIALPIFTKSSSKAKQTTCISNLRQLAMAATMYCQDNKNRYPGLYNRQADGTVSTIYTGWVSCITTYIKGGNNVYEVQSIDSILYCPASADSDVENPISYGYNSCLLKPDGTGVNEAAIKKPTQVGILCDSTPDIPIEAETSLFVEENQIDPTPGIPVEVGHDINIYGGGGIVGGYSLIFSNKNAFGEMGKYLSVYPSGRHSYDGVVVGYADGHASLVPEAFNEKDSNSGVVRSFYMAATLGLVDNPAAGLGGSEDNPFGAVNFAKNQSYTVIGGDPVTRPILMAACEVARKMRNFTYSDDGFNGSLSTEARPGDYLEGAVASYAAPEKIGRQTTKVQIGVDAMVVVVNKGCRIKVPPIELDLTKKEFRHPEAMGSWRQISLRNLQTIIKSDGYGVLYNKARKGVPAGTVSDVHNWQLYLLCKTDRSRIVMAGKAATMTTPGGFDAYFTDGDTAKQIGYKVRWKGGTRIDDADSYRGTYCSNDMDIVDKVSNDTLGIGIVSAAFADPKKVDILAISFGTPETTVTFPTSKPCQYPGIYPSTCTWPFRRNLYAYYTKGKASELVADLSFIKYKNSFKQGPLYKASFWPPESW